MAKTPSKFTQILVASLVGQIEQLGEIALIDVLQNFHDKNPELYKASIKAGHAFITPLLEFVNETKGKLDDGFADAIHNAIDTSAANNGIDLLED
jgi:hypothetical protein